jgi:hypothetical protein
LGGRGFGQVLVPPNEPGLDGVFPQVGRDSFIPDMVAYLKADLQQRVARVREGSLRDGYARPNEANLPGPSLALGQPTIVGALRGLAVNNWIGTFGPFLFRDQPAIDYSLTLMDGASTLKPIQVGFLCYTVENASVNWHCDDLFVPYALIGGGIVARFLDALIRHFKESNVRMINVTVSDKGSRFAPNRADRLALVETINFYKSRSFVYIDPSKEEEERTRLRLDLDGVILTET